MTSNSDDSSNAGAQSVIYLDHHATTPCDQRVVAEMLPWLTENFANPHSDSHSMGRIAGDGLLAAVQEIATTLNGPAENLLITSGATESINLAMRGVMTHPRNRRKKMVVASTEHPAVLDVAADLTRDAIETVWVGTDQCGLIDLDALAGAVDEQTGLVNVMLANNETGTIAPIAEVARITHDAGALLHCDATQAMGPLAVDAKAMDIDLVSASAHKFYGPKGIGFLLAGNGNRRVRLRPQIIGGGQQRGLRSGTMNPAGVVAMASALTLATQEREDETARLLKLRDRFWNLLSSAIEGLQINGPRLELNQHELSSGDQAGQPHLFRLAGNLNFRSPRVEGETWMAATPGVAFSSGSACSSADPTPSHVLLAIGLSESESRRSVRFGLGRFTTEADIDEAARQLIASHHRLSQIGD
ncbi:cysteine desulfurase IscS [Neorhodopirellula lusitana]|uniref:cysteine desulfurase n=1 Tax=Neorhodopirellula lusitana TaxID=445327 RepID=A0ABY1QA74_9BACT|nr:cysteine desulfurase family protein [Neorhodopirellula lusitana]SMP62249.1 cysteine desulfurase IscS [Neorhodopirellula lusitana]